MRRWWFATLVLFATWVGCGPSISRDELGEVMFTLPKVQPAAPVSQEATKAPEAAPQENSEPSS
jgi:hypothetical protein